MPGFQLKVDGKELVTVSSENLNILSIRVQGDVVGQELASIYVSGGNFGGESEDTYLIWIDDFRLTAPNKLDIQFLEAVSNSKPGRTPKGLHPESDDEKQVPLDEPDLAQQLKALGEELERRPKTRDSFLLQMRSPNGEAATFKTKQDDFSFSLTAMWRSTRASSASVWLSTATIDSIVQQRDSERLASERLGFNDKIEFTVGT